MKKILLSMLFVITSLFAFSKKVTITNNEKQALSYMYEEEKLAKDVYYTLGKMYPNLSVFNRIYNAEIVHETSVANVMKHYNLPLPVRGDEIGKFTNPHLQKLYNQLIALGKKSPVDALKAGIMVEVTDVDDLDKYLKTATSPDVIALFKFLRAGSYNHYNAFNWSLKNLTGKTACELMSKEWCKNYPFKRGIGREYRNWYWFAGAGGGMR
ncbi:MAG: DUF2202 domain-containing protein [Epsilonproteobacteria bacterium]|nr:DUF2202 domain-containing protein [Campylobacterota bacterium]